MFISYRPASFTFSLPPLLLSGSPISCVDEYNYLGITFTSSLSWAKHISIVSSKACRLIGLLYHQFYHNSNSTTLLRLYTAFIRPHLEYCSLLWAPTPLIPPPPLKKYSTLPSNFSQKTGYLITLLCSINLIILPLLCFQTYLF